MIVEYALPAAASSLETSTYWTAASLVDGLRKVRIQVRDPGRVGEPLRLADEGLVRGVAAVVGTRDGPGSRGRGELLGRSTVEQHLGVAEQARVAAAGLVVRAAGLGVAGGVVAAERVQGHETTATDEQYDGGSGADQLVPSADLLTASLSGSGATAAS